MNSIFQQYWNQVSITQLLTAKEEQECARIIQKAAGHDDYANDESISGDPEKARLKLYESNLRLVVSIANKIGPKYGIYINHVGYLDIIQEGNIGLGRAINKFEPRGVKFSTYAT